MCDGELIRDPTAPLYPTSVGGLQLVPPRPGIRAITMREIGVGRLLSDAVFRCVPRGPGRPPLRSRQREHRVVVQVRRDVTIRLSSIEGPSVSQDLDGQIAICAFGDSAGGTGRLWTGGESAYTWVQTGHFRPERVVRFDGRDERVDLGWRGAGGRPGFVDRGEAWWIDSRSRNTARYAGVGFYLHPLGHPNGEIIYDSPDLAVGYSARLTSEPHIRLIETTAQFRTYLYHRLGGYRGIAPLDPLALVEWWHTERWERSAEGEEPRRTGSDVRVLWILPSPIEPPRLDDAIRTFRFR